MALTGTYKNKTSDKITKFFWFGRDSGLPEPFSSPTQFGERSRVSEYRREIKNFSSNLTIGGMNITTLDAGSVFATHLNGSHFTGKAIEIYLESADHSENMKVFDGFVGDTQYANGILQFGVIDRYYNIKDAKLEFDYKSISHSALGWHWGTVVSVSGSNVYFRFPNQTEYTEYIHTPSRRTTNPDDFDRTNYRYLGDESNQTVGRRKKASDSVRAIYRNLGEYDNFVTEANFAKFIPPDKEYSGLFNDSDEFDEIKSYKVSGQLNTEDDEGNQLTWVNPNGVTMDVKEGTLELEGNVRGIKSGYKIYFRLPLYLAGNPIQIIGSLARGDYNNLPDVLGTLPVDEDSFATMSVYCGNMHTFKEYTDSGKGDVANIITKLSEESFFDVWISKDGTMHFSAIKPYGNSISVQGSFFNDENAWGFKYSDNMDDVAYRIDAKYGIRSYPDYTTYDLVSKERESSKNKFHNRAIILDKDYEFYHDEDEVITFISRELFWRRHGVTRWEWESPLFGLDMELGSYTTIRNEIFPTGSHIVYCDSIGIDLDNNTVKFTGWDYTNYFLNTYMLTWHGDALANPTTVTGTSNSGWVRLDPEMIGSYIVGTVSGTATGSLATIIMYHTNKTLEYKYSQDILATTGYHLKKKRLLAESYDGLFWGTFLYRYQRLWGNEHLHNGASVQLFAIGTDDDSIYRCGLPISQLRNTDGDFVGGTTPNLTSPYGTSSIFW